jgi:hypothetical protein
MLGILVGMMQKVTNLLLVTFSEILLYVSIQCYKKASYYLLLRALLNIKSDNLENLLAQKHS